MENTLTLSDICCYLPYGLEIKLNIPSGSAVYKVIQMNENSVKAIYKYPINDRIAHLGEFKPLLRPLSSLTKEITVNGKTFIPIVELAKIAESDNYKYESLRVKSSNLTIGCAWHNEGTIYGFCWSKEHNAFYLKAEPYKDLIIANQSILLDKLSEWFFDYKSNLISRGLALEIQD